MYAHASPVDECMTGDMPAFRTTTGGADGICGGGQDR